MNFMQDPEFEPRHHKKIKIYGYKGISITFDWFIDANHRIQDKN